MQCKIGISCLHTNGSNDENGWQMVTRISNIWIQIIAMENNGIRAKGTYRLIESKDYELIQEWNSIIAKENARDESIWYVNANFFVLFRFQFLFSFDILFGIE